MTCKQKYNFQRLGGRLPVLGQLGISLGPGMIESVMASVDSGRIKYLTIGMSLELRYSLIDN